MEYAKGLGLAPTLFCKNCNNYPEWYMCDECYDYWHVDPSDKHFGKACDKCYSHPHNNSSSTEEELKNFLNVYIG